MIFRSGGQIVLLLWWQCEKSVNSKEEVVHFDPLQFFSRLISIAERTNKFTEYFKYELAQEPTSLFKNGFIRDSHKSDLQNIFIENAHNFETYSAIKIVTQYSEPLNYPSLGNKR